MFKEIYYNVYGNILENIHRAAKDTALGYQDKKKNNKLWWIGEID